MLASERNDFLGLETAPCAECLQAGVLLSVQWLSVQSDLPGPRLLPVLQSLVLLELQELC